MSDLAAQFDGNIANKLTANSNTVLTRAASDPITIVLWVWPDCAANQGIALVDSTTFAWFIDKNLDYAPRIQFNDSDGTTSAGSVAAGPFTVLDVGRWNMFVVRYNAGTKLLRYECNRDTANALSYTASRGFAPSATGRLTLPSNYNGTTPLAGRVAMLGVWPVELSDLELTWMYNSRGGRHPTEFGQGGNDGSALLTKLGVKGDIFFFEESAGSNRVGIQNSVTLVPSGTVPTVPGVSTTQVTAGTLTLTSSDPSAVVFSVTPSGGNSGSLTTKLYRLPDPLTPHGTSYLVDTQSAGNGVARTLTDHPPDELVYYYRAVSTDSAGQYAFSDLHASRWKAPIYVVDVGDSVTAAPTTGVIATPSAGTSVSEISFTKLLTMVGPRRGTLNNQAVAGQSIEAYAPAYTSASTGLPVAAGSKWTATKAAIDAGVAAAGAANTYVNWMLGNNNAGGSQLTPATSTLEAIDAIIAYVSTVGAKILLHDMGYKTPYTATQYAQALQVALDAKADNITAFRPAGAANTFRLFAANYPTWYSDTQHPNSTGIENYSRIKAHNMAQVVEPVAVATKLSRYDLTEITTAVSSAIRIVTNSSGQVQTSNPSIRQS